FELHGSNSEPPISHMGRCCRKRRFESDDAFGVGIVLYVCPRRSGRLPRRGHARISVFTGRFTQYHLEIISNLRLVVPRSHRAVPGRGAGGVNRPWGNIPKSLSDMAVFVLRQKKNRTRGNMRRISAAGSALAAGTALGLWFGGVPMAQQKVLEIGAQCDRTGP